MDDGLDLQYILQAFEPHAAQVVQAAAGASKQEAGDILAAHLLEETITPSTVPEDILKEVLDAKDVKRYASEHFESVDLNEGEEVASAEKVSFQRLLRRKLLEIEPSPKPDGPSAASSAKALSPTAQFIQDSDKEYWHSKPADNTCTSDHIKAHCPQGGGYQTLVSRGNAQAHWLNKLILLRFVVTHVLVSECSPTQYF